MSVHLSMFRYDTLSKIQFICHLFHVSFSCPPPQDFSAGSQSSIYAFLRVVVCPVTHVMNPNSQRRTYTHGIFSDLGTELGIFYMLSQIYNMGIKDKMKSEVSKP